MKDNQSIKNNLLIPIIFILLLSGCITQQSQINIREPQNTITATTVEEISTQIALPATTAKPQPLTPTATQAREISLEHISIQSPGNGSEISSPVHISGESDPTFEQNLTILITDENGKQIAITNTQINAGIGKRGPFEADLNFVVAADQPGRITIIESNAANGSLNHLSSVEVKLLASGSKSIKPTGSKLEQISIHFPEFQEEVEGGLVQVSGFSSYFFEANLAIVICGEGGTGEPHQLCGTQDNVLGTGIAMIASPEIGEAGPFNGKAQYHTTESQRGQVIVYATSARDGGILHAAHQAISIKP